MTAAPTSDELLDLAAFAERLADRARLETLARFRAHGPTVNKSEDGFDPVTEADRAAERAIRELIAEEYPDHGVLGEEHPETPANGPWRWTIDPIDGTRSFVIGAPLWTTLIALSFEDRPVVGVIDCPVLDERWIGAAGETTFCANGERNPARARQCLSVADAVISCTDPMSMFDGAEAGGFELLRAAARMTRLGMDAYAYGLLASGGVDLVIEAGLQTYDVCALIPVIEGAGGVVTDWTGAQKNAWRGGQIAAMGDDALRHETISALRRAARPVSA